MKKQRPARPTADRSDAVTMAHQHIHQRFNETVKSPGPLIAYVGEGEHDMQRNMKSR